MTHDPLCPKDVVTMAFAGQNVPVCACPLIAATRADERSRKGTCWREAEGSQIPSGAVRVYREAGWFWEML